jgi:cytoskeletal protein RodZ
MGIGLEHIPKEVGGKSETEGLITVAELLTEIHQQPAVDAFRRDAKVAEASVSDATTPETETTAAAANTVVPQAERVRLRSLRKELYMAFEGNVESGADEVEGSEEVVTGPETVVKGPEDVREVEKVEKAPSGSAGSAAGAGSVVMAAKPPSALPKQLVVAAVVALIAMVLGLIYELIAGR